MNFRKILQKLFNGSAILEKGFSSINGKILVLEDLFGNRNLLVGGLEQSGPSVWRIWQKAIKPFEKSQGKQFNNLTIKQCLILGLGAGSVARLISQLYPSARILGVEIDPEIIRLGKKYFGLGEIKKLEIINTDAITWIVDGSNDSNHRTGHFNLILVDLYIGSKTPEEIEKDEFLLRIKKTLSPEGIAIFNRFYSNEEEREGTDGFGKKLRECFRQVEEKEILRNKLFFCSFR